MLKKFNILLVAFYLLTLSAPVCAGGFKAGSSHFTVNHNTFYRHKSRDTNQSFAKHNMKFHRKLHHKIKGKNKIRFPYHIYYPHYALYERHSTEKQKGVEINIINVLNDKKIEQIESTIDQDRSYSPPRIMNLGDIAPNRTKNVIVIYGTRVIETKISSD